MSVFSKPSISAQLSLGLTACHVCHCQRHGLLSSYEKYAQKPTFARFFTSPSHISFPLSFPFKRDMVHAWPWRHSAKWNEPGTKEIYCMIHRNTHIHMIHRNILHDSTSKEVPRGVNSDTESGMVWPELGRKWEWFTGIEFQFGKMKIFIWMVVRVTQYKCIYWHRTIIESD